MSIPKNVVLFCVPLLALTACGESNKGSPSTQPGQAQLTVTLADKTLASALPARLSIDPSRPSFEVSASVGQGAEAWWFNTSLDQSAVEAGTASVSIGGQQTALGRGPATQAGSGLLTLQIARGGISGSAKTDSKTFDASFVGALYVSCVVPRSLLPSVNGTSGTVGEGEAKVEDARFETSLCAPYRALALK